MNVEIILDDPAGNSYVQVNSLPVSSLCFVSTFQRKLPLGGWLGWSFSPCHRSL